MPIRVDNIPEELRQAEQWVCWREIQTTNGLSKVPINPHSLSFAKVNNINTWGKFETALEVFIRNKVDGIGFVFSEGDPFIGIDLDDCFRLDGVMFPRIRKIVDVLDSYTELSPSREGIHIIVKSPNNVIKKDLPPMKKKGFEIYPRKRFFTVTSLLLKGAPIKIAERHIEIKKYIDEHDKALKNANPIEKLIPANTGACPLCFRFERTLTLYGEGQHSDACPRSPNFMKDVKKKDTP